MVGQLTGAHGHANPALRRAALGGAYPWVASARHMPGLEDAARQGSTPSVIGRIELALGRGAEAR